MRTFISALLLCVGALLAQVATAAPQFPKLTGRVVDDANVLPPDVEQRLTQKLEALETQSQRQVVVATVPDLQGLEISDYGYQLGRAWGIGGKERNDGVLLLVAPTERKVRIEVGYGLEGVLPDGLGFLIINNDIVPRFKAGDMPAGIEAGTDAIIKQLTLPPEQAQQIAAQAVRQGTQSRDQGFPIGGIIFMLFILFFFILPILRAMGGRGGRRRGGFGSPIIFLPGGFGGGGFGGGRGGFGGGGGGFSGGGGSFGGGGASGSW